MLAPRSVASFPGGVPSPVAAGAVGGSDRAAGVDSEHIGKHRRWNLLGELIQRGEAGALRFDPEIAEPVAQRGGADVPSGAIPGEQPWCGQLFGRAVASPLRKRPHEIGERLGESQEIRTQT